jgi:hypothetical protein
MGTTFLAGGALEDLCLLDCDVVDEDNDDDDDDAGRDGCGCVGS